jgi:hypothetical protein
MRRRKLLAGLGSLAAGGAAVMGTGAVTSVNANRTVDVEIAGDDSAYLRLDDVDSHNSNAFVNTDDGEVSFDFGSENSDVFGDGFNSNSVTVLDQLLRVGNLSGGGSGSPAQNNELDFSVDFADLDLSDGNGGQAYVALQVVTVGNTGNPKSAGNRDTNQNQNVAFNAGSENINGSYSGFNGQNALSDYTPEPWPLSVGEVIELDMIVDTRDFDPPSGTSFPLDTSGTVKFIAE